MLLAEASTGHEESVWLNPSTGDGELCMKHTVEAGRSKLVVLMTKLVGDLKLARRKEAVISVLQQIENSLGNSR